MTYNLFDRLSRTARERPLILRDGGALSHGQLRDLSGQIANALVDLRLKPGDRIAVQVEKSVASLALYLAALRAGAVFLPLNTAYTLKEMEYFLSDARPSVVVCDPSVAANLAMLPACPPALKTLDVAGEGELMEIARDFPMEFRTVSREADDIAAILYTSGTTGRPKGAMLSHHNLSSNAETLREIWRFSEEDVLLHALPVYHAHGLFVAANLALLTGASMHFLPRFDVESVIALLPASTVMMGVPTFYTRLVTDPRLVEASRNMRLFISGSAPLLPETHRAWAAATNHRILERYGMTETCMLTSNPYIGDRVPGSVGMPLPGVDLRIVDPESGEDLPLGAIGMIEVRGPNVFKGYWQMPEKTAAEFRADGFFITGDLGRLDDEGYVHIVGRGKDLVITGGLNVYPREVEAEIDEMAGVLESSVIGLPHPDFGEAVTAVVVAEGPLDEADVIAYLDGKLSKFKQPKRVFFLDALPRNAMGKVQKNLLREVFADSYHLSPASAGPSARREMGDSE
jgi:malonyl-CoA/methylmalonyl-CoA synthetase